MKQLLIFLFSALTLIFSVFIPNKADAQNYIYLLDFNNSNWYPITSNEDNLQKLYETSEGSNVYQGNVYFNYDYNYFRFVTFLQDVVDVSEINYHKGVIAPNNFNFQLKRAGESEILFQDNVRYWELASPYESVNTWVLNNPGIYNTTVDLNKGTLLLVPADRDQIFVIQDNPSGFNPENPEEYSTLDFFEQYLPEGDHSIYLYSYHKKAWLDVPDQKLDEGWNQILSYPETYSPEPVEIVLSSPGGILNGHFFRCDKNSLSQWSEELKEALFINYYTNEIKIWEDCPESVLERFRYIPKTGENKWSGYISIASQELFNIICHVSSKDEENKVIYAPFTNDSELNFIDGYAYSKGIEKLESDAGYWYSNQKFNGIITVTKEGDTYKILFDDENLANFPSIFLIGSPQGWDIDKGNWPLYLTDSGGYYGSFYIEEEAPIFRFFTKLGDWEKNSIGTQWQDSPIEFSIEDGRLDCNALDGKGSWCLTDWEPGTLYIYVNLQSYRVILSKEPIEEAGEILPIERKGMKEGIFISLNEFPREQMIKIGEGKYAYNFSSSKNSPCYFRLFTKELPISHFDPEWVGSYTISTNDNPTLDFSKSLCHEVDITINNTVGTEPASEFQIINQSDSYTYYQMIVDINQMKVYIADMGGGYVLPSSGYTIPDASTADNYIDRRIPYNGSAIIDIPKNEFDIWFQTGSVKTTPTDIHEISFDEDPFVVSDNLPVGWQLQRIKCDNWEGGKVLLDGMEAYDMSKLQQIKVITGTDNSQVLKRKDQSSLVFTGTVQFYQPLYEYYLYESTISFEIASKMVTHTNGYEISQTLTVGCPISNVYSGVEDADRSLILQNGRGSMKVGFNSMPILLPNISTGKFNITLDLDNLTLSIEQTEGPAVSSYEIVADDESPLNGVRSFVDAATGNLLFEVMIVSNKNGFDFNFLRSDGTVITPPTGTRSDDPGIITFDEWGLWKGNYSDRRPDYVIMSTADDRQKAKNANKWHFDIPEGEYCVVSFMLNETDKELTVFSMAHNKHFFISTTATDDAPYIANLVKFKERILKDNGDGIFKGKVEIPNGWDKMNMTFYKAGYNNGYGLIRDSYGKSTEVFDLTNTEEQTQPAWYYYKEFYNGIKNYYPAQTWIIFGEPAVYDVTYDENKNALTVAYFAPLAVEKISTEENSIKVFPDKNGVTVKALNSSHLKIYNVSGVMVKSLEVPPGRSQVSLAPGMYIINGQKLMVK